MTNEEKINKLNEIIAQVHAYKHTPNKSTALQDEIQAYYDTVAAEVSTWDITEAEFEDLYNVCDRRLTVLSDLTDPINARDGFKTV